MIPFLTALLVALVLTAPTIALLTGREVMDVPNLRSSHVVAVPRGGGIALLLGVGAGTAVGWLLDGVVTSPWEHPGILCLSLVAGTAAFAALGLRDDLRGLPAPVRLLTQVVLSTLVVAVMAWAAPAGHALLVVVVGIVWVTGYVNAYNFMDGINGISAVAAALAGGWFLLLGARAHDSLVTVTAAALAGGALGFLPWNAPRARVFLGDVGSYGVGFLIAGLALLTAVRDHDVWLGLAPAVVYLADTSWTLLRRLRNGEPVLEAHRTHVYQRLTDRGLSHVASTGVVGAATTVVLAAAWLLPTALAVVVALAVVAGYLVLPEALGRRTTGVTR